MREKRKAERKSVANKVALEPWTGSKNTGSKKVNIAFTDDMSLCGLKIMADTSYPIDSSLNMSISIKNSARIIHVMGKVRWSKKLGDEAYEMGIEIMETDQENIRALYEHLYTQRRGS